MRLLALVGIFLFGGHEARSQNLYVGSNFFNQTTNLTSGTNAYSNTYIGYSINSAYNTLNVFNGNTLLTNSGDTFIGYAGPNNSMVIYNGATVSDSNAWIGYTGNGFANDYGNGNSVMVSDGGTVWTNSGLIMVGNGGFSNSLLVYNGASVTSSNLVVGGSNAFNGYPAGNTALVSGMGTNGSDARLYAQRVITVGSNSSGNSLVASNGGQVTAYGGLIIGNGGNNNTVFIAGYDASNNPSTILAQNTTNGLNGSYNTLIISNGGVLNTGQLLIGFGGTSNSVIVNGGVLNAYIIDISPQNSLVWNGGTIDVGTSLGVGDGEIRVYGGTLVLNAPATNPNGLLTSINLVQSGSNIPTLSFSNSVGASSSLSSIDMLLISDRKSVV